MKERKQANPLLLTEEETKPYWEWVDDGDGYNQRQDWDIKGLLEAQLAKVQKADPKLREKVTDWLYNTLKEIEVEENIRLSDRAFIADHLAPKIIALFPVPQPNLLVREKALAVIEGSLLVDEPDNKRFSFIYRMAHVGGGECEHKDWIEEMESCYQQLIKENIISPVALEAKAQKAPPKLSMGGFNIPTSPIPTMEELEQKARQDVCPDCMGACGSYDEDDGDYEHSWIPCFTCQGKKPDPKLREKIAIFISEFKDWDGARQYVKDGWLHKADHIIALIDNRDAEVRKQEREKLSKALAVIEVDAHNNTDFRDKVINYAIKLGKPN